MTAALTALAALASACSSSPAPGTTMPDPPASVSVPATAPGGARVVTLPPDVDAGPDNPGPRPDDDEFDETTMLREDLVPFDRLPKVAAEPVATLNDGLAVFVFYELTFDEYVDAQRTALRDAGWTVDDVVAEKGRWAFEAAKGPDRTAGGALACGPRLTAPDGPTLDVCDALPAEMRGGRTPRVQVNVYLPRP